MKDDSNKKPSYTDDTLIDQTDIPLTEQEDDDSFVFDEDGANTLSLLKKTKEALKECRAEKEENLTGWQRARADLVNYKQQVVRERDLRTKQALEDFILELLSVLDSFDMAMKDTTWQSADEKWQGGVLRIRDQLVRVLEKNEVTLISPEGEKFDPTLHESMQAVSTKEGGDAGTVAEVFQAGARYRGELIRPARVSVYDDI